MGTTTEREAQQVERANESGRSPVVFIHGLWLMPSSWDRWAQLFEEAGYAALTPPGPTTPRPSSKRGRTPTVAKKNLGQIADHSAR